jgi:RimJ/RimL family protein N-acetyltransferase
MNDNIKEPKPLILEGERVVLRPLEEGDIKFLHRWGSDSEIMALTGDVEPMSLEGARAFYDKVQIEDNRLWFTVVVKDGDRPIGEAGLLRMFKPWHTTDLTMIIGEKDAWGKGYGTEAIRLLLDYTFQELNFHRVAVGVVGFNERALRFYEKIGFKKEGIQRDGYYIEGKYSDFIMMSILREEYVG